MTPNLSVDSREGPKMVRHRWASTLLVLMVACGKPGSARVSVGTGSVAKAASAAVPRTTTSAVAHATPSPGGPQPRGVSAQVAADVRMNDLVEAEYRRDSSVIGEADLSRREPRLRRAAARALAQILDERALGLLGRALGDEDPQVMAWAVHGLGVACRSRETKTVHALVSRAASLAIQATPHGSAATPMDPDAVMTDALARCASSEGEATLRAWLRGPRHRAEMAALALGRVAAQNSRLDDASIVALLESAAEPKGPQYALYPFSRLNGLSQPAEQRLYEVLGPALATPDLRRAFALRALGKSGEHAADRLGKIVIDRGFLASERATAARELARLGDPGQRALGQALEALVPREGSWSTLLGPDFGPLRATLDGLGPEVARRARMVNELAGLDLPADCPPPLRRRLVRLRCRAAVLLAGRAIQDQRLLACDPDPRGRLGALAQVEVLGQSEIRGVRDRRWRAWLASEDPVVRQAALALLPSHPEIARPAEILGSALRASDDGTVTAAAQILAAHPDLAGVAVSAGEQPDAGLRPATELTQSLAQAFAVERPADAIQRRCALIDAAGTLELLNLKPAISAACFDPNPTLRLHAEKALRLLGEGTRQCDHGSWPRNTKFERYPSGHRPRLRLLTDAGTRELVLDPAWAPAAVRRVVDLARAKFYDGTVIHRVVPGFVVQFGDPGGDGYGGAGRQPVPSETAPIPFGRLAVGMAAAGRDTGSNQLFVSLGELPHLDADYAWIGRAEDSWEAVDEGDVIQRVEVIE
jgi:cyclophilin family peptidyl-prolyl cis-trans isomerase